MNGVVHSLLDDEEYRNGILFSSFRTTKKPRLFDSTNADSNSVAKRIVPKLGPSFIIRVRDSDNLKSAISALVATDQETINSGLNYLMGWSTIVNDHMFTDEVKEVICALIELILKSMEKSTETSVDHFERAQFNTLISNSSMQCSVAGTILKNLILSSEKSFRDDEVLNSKARNLLLFTLTSFHEMEYSLMKDLILLHRKVTSYQGQESTIANGLLHLVMQNDLPLRLRLGALDALADLIQQEEVQDLVEEVLQSKTKELALNLKIFTLLTMEMALEEAQLEFDGCLDYEGLALLYNDTTSESQKNDELRLWAWKLQSEALLSTTNFLKSIARLNVMDALAFDESLLQALVDLTTGKKMTELSNERKGFLDSKHIVMVSVRRNVHTSEMQAYKAILEVAQEGSAKLKQRIKQFEKSFILSAFDTTWQAKQCALILSFLNDI
eukprot:g7148.t1